ncbi:BAF_collapsed_G0053620.mRNA.1.CDS.1 [Saccharomyces cerevisiae]|nr:CFA_G0052200.mRNA.1.CDS.1 [Saccharomyces cerevisiae]CAI5329823.1 BAF_HP2_G0052400.mRNA.1.CDS.1 [Saccharomyces cerevisiae]CAI6771023.1 BAF_HP2_G0052400.mRNA.1.CDS.1 [Saccharomyces cerevisiae]CAI6804059.1 BAF_HP1_G0052320.mRNA.1.CDS.1 [Saccharomyces cerevisiae]CAI7370476.1 BAF_collapsed_G0053620.mRNA.1.CDS.1 [Saccharomyces cerevisiae]
MKLLFKRCSSSHIGKLIKDSLITPEILPQLGQQPSSHKRLPNNKRTNSITDKWLKDALTRKDKLNEDKLQNVNLRLNVVLTTLQKLRTSDNPALYFALLNRIGTGHIKWLNKSGRQIDAFPPDRLPLEFYHELSNMLYKLSLRSANDKIALAKFSLQLLDRYYFLKTKSLTVEGKFRANIKFLRNCTLLIVKSQSNYYLRAIQRLFAENSEGQLLANLSQLAFYVETSQWTNMLDILSSCVPDSGLRGSKERERAIQLLELFSPCLVKSLKVMIAQNMENEACQILRSLSEWNFHFDQHDSSNLIQLSQNHSCLKVIETMNGLSSTTAVTRQFGLEKLPTDVSLKQSIHILSKDNFEPLKQDSFLQFLSFKLSDLPLNLEVWKKHIKEVDDQMQAESNLHSLRAFFIDMLLCHLSVRKDFDFMLSLVEHIVYEKNLWQPLLLTDNIVGNKENSTFHCLFHGASQDISTKLTLLALYNQLNEIGYQFTSHDFLSMLKVCKNYSDSDFFYFAFYNLLVTQSHKFFLFDKFSDKFSWRLPIQIGDAISEWLSSLEIDIQENTDRVLQITDDVGEWYVENKPFNSEKGTIQPINIMELRKIFGERKTLFHMDSEIFQKSKAKRDKEMRNEALFTANDAEYNFAADVSYAKRVENLFSYIRSKQMQQK